MSENQKSDKEIKLRCIGIAMGVLNQQHQFDVQSWMQAGREGTPPAGGPPPPPTMVDIFADSDEIFEYVSKESVLEESAG